MEFAAQMYKVMDFVVQEDHSVPAKGRAEKPSPADAIVSLPLYVQRRTAGESFSRLPRRPSSSRARKRLPTPTSSTWRTSFAARGPCGCRFRSQWTCSQAGLRHLA